MEEVVGTSADLRKALTCDRPGNCCNCAEWFTHQDHPGPCVRVRHIVHVIRIHVVRIDLHIYAHLGFLAHWDRCICAGFRKQLPTILATWLAACDWRENPLSGRSSAAESMRSSSLNRSLLNDWSNFPPFHSLYTHFSFSVNTLFTFSLAFSLRVLPNSDNTFFPTKILSVTQFFSI